MKITGWGTKQAKQPLEHLSYEPLTLGDHEINIAITHCGVCHSDLDIIDNTWHDTQYPIIPGHEVIGTIKAIGKLVKGFSIGQRVGASFQQDACGHCPLCLANQIEFCKTFVAVGLGHQGGFASHITVKDAFVFDIPDTIDSAHAAPLLCAGATVYNAIQKYQPNEHSQVAVVGMGGLGHLAIQFLATSGCLITVFDSAEEKEADAIRFGANALVNPKAPEIWEKYQQAFDFILVTADKAIDLEQYVHLLKPHGTLCFAGMPSTPMELPLFAMIIADRSISAINIGNPSKIKETLAFAARHQIKPQIELLPMSQANVALDKLRGNKARYRIVLQNDEKTRQ